MIASEWFLLPVLALMIGTMVTYAACLIWEGVAFGILLIRRMRSRLRTQGEALTRTPKPTDGEGGQ